MNQDPECGTVLVLEGEGTPGAYDNQPGISFHLGKEKLLRLSPMDGPIHLEAWGAGGGIAYEGDTEVGPDSDPEALSCSDGGTHLYGLMPDGRRVFTAPIADIQRWVPNGTPFATVVDGLVFELGTPDPEWLAASAYPPAEVLEQFISTFAPLNLLPTSQYPRTMQ